MPDIGNILENHLQWAYIVLLIWTFLEGETIVIIAGVVAREGQLSLPLIILCAFCGSLCSDQLMFLLGRYKGQAFVARRPKWQMRAERVYRLLERHQTWLILGFRFLYGLRNITPFAIGMSQVPTRRFIVLNIIGAAVWAATFASAGYLFGTAMESIAASHHRRLVLIGMAVVAAIVWVARILRRRAALKNESLGAVERKDA